MSSESIRIFGNRLRQIYIKKSFVSVLVHYETDRRNGRGSVQVQVVETSRDQSRVISVNVKQWSSSDWSRVLHTDTAAPSQIERVRV